LERLPELDRREPLGFLLGPERFDEGTVFGPEEKLAFATLEAVEVALWKVFEVAG
jgi:hypothetical protein